ncbi:MAG: hypothetical protein ABW169_00025 [Sphingobium sp.]
MTRLALPALLLLAGCTQNLVTCPNAKRALYVAEVAYARVCPMR